MSQEPTETASTTVRPAGGTVNEAVRASMLAVQASHRAARRRVLRDRVTTSVAAVLTITAVWGLSRQFGSQDDVKLASTAAAESAGDQQARTDQLMPQQKMQAPESQQLAASAEVPEGQPLAASPAAPAAAEDLIKALVIPAPAAPTGALDPAVAAACDKAAKRNHWLKISTVCATAYEQAPNAERALSVAQAYHRRGRIPEAGQWAERVLALEPSHPEAFIILAHAAEQAEQKAKAKAAYRQYLALAPRGWHAIEARQALGVIE